MSDLLALADRVEAGKGCDNALDVVVEVALFEPCALFVKCRPNAAGTKVIYVRPSGSRETYWAMEWTSDRAKTAAELRSRSLASLPPEGGIV